MVLVMEAVSVVGGGCGGSDVDGGGSVGGCGGGGGGGDGGGVGGGCDGGSADRRGVAS